MSGRESKSFSRRQADLRLVQDCLARQPGAWEELVRGHEATLYHSILHALRLHGRHPDQAEVQELQAELFFRLVRDDFRRLQRFGGRSTLKAWLKVVAGNFVIDHLRKRRADLSLDDPASAQLRRRLATPDASPDARVKREEARALLRQLVGRLPPDDRRFVDLYYARELSFEAVAEAMGTTVGAAYSRKNRVHKRLAALLRQHRRTTALTVIG